MSIKNEETVADVFDTLNEKQKKVVCFMMAQTLEENKRVFDTLNEKQKKALKEIVQDVFNTLNEKQKTVVYFLVAKAFEEAEATLKEGDKDV